MESSSYWILFFSSTLAITVSPGPDLIYVLSKTITQGRRVGFASSLGVCTGAFIHVLAAALGLSAIIATSAVAFSVVKYIGVGYLVYLGIQALMSKGVMFDIQNSNTKKTTPWNAFGQGALVDILNPKAAIFFMAFLPQFIRPELGHSSAQILLLGVLVILVAIIVEFSLVLTAARTTGFFRKNPRFSVWLDRILGSVLIGLAVRLAFAEGQNALTDPPTS